MTDICNIDSLDILKYWLLTIRYEEALAARPKAIRSRGLTREQIRTKSPVSERDYFKIPLDDAAVLLEKDGKFVDYPVEGEVAEFFEGWLGRQYRAFDKGAEGPEMMVICPVVHLAGGELAGLIRFEVKLSFFSDDQKTFEVPSALNRKKGIYPLPPTFVRVERILTEEKSPIFVDPKLMENELGVTPEELQTMFSAWQHMGLAYASPEDFLREVLALFSKPLKNGFLLSQAVEAMTKRLSTCAPKAACYSVGLVLDSRKTRATFRLQKDLESLTGMGVSGVSHEILKSYLDKTPLTSTDTPLCGLFDGLSASMSQKRAAAFFLGSKLIAVEGPPGTGKTSVILHLLAHRLVSNIANLAKSGSMPSTIITVCSSNNRAVDNVIERLATNHSEDISLGLRVGNRKVCETVTADEIGLTIKKILLLEQNKNVAEINLKSELSHFKSCYEKLSDIFGQAQARTMAIAEKQLLETELNKKIEKAEGMHVGSNMNLQQINDLFRMLKSLDNRFRTLSRKCEKKPSKERLSRLLGYYERSISDILKKTQEQLLLLNIEQKIFEPPDLNDIDMSVADIDDIFAVYEDGAEDARDTIHLLLDEIESFRNDAQLNDSIAQIKSRLASIVIPPEVQIDESEADVLRHELFASAVKVRSAYIALNSQFYLEALRAALKQLETTASLRRLKSEYFKKIKELFPLWGCTLLSLGNIFDDEPLGIDEVIIDEAGQCHPAHAVSALMRCRKALIMGDVHQLEPVFTLSEAEEKGLLKAVVPKSVSINSIDPDIRVFDKSFASVQRLAEAACQEVYRLTDHFRCQKEIIEISNRLCNYGLTTHTPKRSRVSEAPCLCDPVLFLHVNGEQQREGGSRFNANEVNAVCDLVSELISFGIGPDEIAVITPYRAQLMHLKRALAFRQIPLDLNADIYETIDSEGRLSKEQCGTAIGTVHRFQGGERSVVIFSTVITDENNMGFLNDRVNLINVAVSRAMEHLVIVGYEPVLRQGILTRSLFSGLES